MNQRFNPSDIGAVVGFTTEELMINRGGGMSERQRALLRRRFASVRVREAVGIAQMRARRIVGADPNARDHVNMRYELTIGRTTFFVTSRAVLDAFAPGGSYRAYYAIGGRGSGRLLLSAERIG